MPPSNAVLVCRTHRPQEGAGGAAAGTTGEGRQHRAQAASSVNKLGALSLVAGENAAANLAADTRHRQAGWLRASQPAMLPAAAAAYCRQGV
jgi:hypothetical protein